MQLDLEEQEQIASLRHFWQKYGRLISITLLVFVLTVAGWQTWQWWQTRQSAQAAVVFERFNAALLQQTQGGQTQETQTRQASQAGLKKYLAQLQSDYASTSQSSLATLRAAAWFSQTASANPDDLSFAQAQWQWLQEHASDDGIASLARLGLSSVLLQQKNYAAARAALEKIPAESFTALFADRLGDIALAEGKSDEAKAQYAKAQQAIQAADQELSAQFASLQANIRLKQQLLGVAPATP